MEATIYILLILGLIIVPWIMGFIYIIKLFIKLDRRKSAADDLFYLADVESDPDKKLAYLQAARYLSQKSPVQEKSEITVQDEWRVKSDAEIYKEIYNGETEEETPTEKPAESITEIFRQMNEPADDAAKPAAISEDAETITDIYRTTQNVAEPVEEEIKPAFNLADAINERFKSLQNINILLYLGAFMVIVSAGIFVGFNYQSLSGTYKTIFLSVFAMVFYLAGLLLYLKSKNIKEAGLTFHTIGLILFPLVGLAYYKFVSHGDGNTIWFITSIVTAAFYTLSLLLIKNTYLAYFVSLVTLSLFESFISIFEMPIYYFAWGMALSSIIFLLISKTSLKEQAVIESFDMSAKYFLPVSIIFAIFTIKTGLTGLGVNLLLAGLFYLVSSFLQLSTSQKEQLFTSAMVLFPLGTLLVLIDKHFTAINTGIIMCVFAVLYTVVYEKLKTIYDDQRPRILLLIGCFIPVFSCYLFNFSDYGMIITLFTVMILHGYSYYRVKMPVNLIFAILALLIIPRTALYAYGNYSVELMSLIYLFVSIALFRLKLFIGQSGKFENYSLLSAYIIALIISSLLVLLNDAVYLLAALLILAQAVYVYYLSYFEDKSFSEFFAGLLFYTAVIKFGQHFAISDFNYLWLFFGTGILFYALSMVPTRRSRIFAYLGMAGSLISIVGLMFSSNYQDAIWLMLANLAFVYSLSYLENRSVFEYVTVAVFMLLGIKLNQHFQLSVINYYCTLFASGIILFTLSMLPSRRSEIFLYGGIIGPFISLLAIFNHDNYLTAALLMLANLIFFYSLSYIKNRFVFETAAGIICYFTMIKSAQHFDFPDIYFLCSIFLTGLLLFGISQLPLRRSDAFLYVSLAGPIYSLSTMFNDISIATGVYLMAANTLFFYGVSYVKNRGVFESIAAVMLYMTAVKFSMYMDYSGAQLFAALFVAGMILFALSKLPIRRSDELYYASILGPFISLFTIFTGDKLLLSMLLLFANMIFFYYNSFINKKRDFKFVTVIVVYLAGIKCGQYLDLSSVNFIWAYLASGVLLFIFGMLPFNRSKIFTYGALAGPIYSVIYGFTIESMVPIYALSVFGAMCMKLSFDEKSDICKYFSAGIFVAALNWYLNYSDITEMQYYTASWAIFFGVLSYLRYRVNDKRGQDITAVLALAFLTIPTFFQSINHANKLLYALILGVESIVLIIGAIAANYKLVMRWAVIALVVDILYQSRDYMAAVPKWMIIGLVGIGILAGATYLLSRRNKEE